MDYQGNSRKEKEQQQKEPKKIEKVVVSEVIQRPPSIGFKFKSIFMGDNFRDTSRWVVGEVVRPTVQGLFFDVIIETARNMIFPGGRRYYSKRPYGGAGYAEPRQSHYSYDNPGLIRPDLRDASHWRDSRSITRANPPDQAGRKETRSEPSEIVIGSREDAESVLEQMIDVIDQWDEVSLADYYAMLGLPSSPIDNTWGWKNLITAKVRQIREGYIIELPRMESL